MNIELKHRLLLLENRLKERGVVDISFDVDHSKNSNADKIAHDIIEVIEAYLDGNFQPSFGLGDSINPATIAYFEEKRRRYEQDNGVIV